MISERIRRLYLQNGAKRPILNKGGETMLESLSADWCKAFHDRTTWPIHGRYTCLKCGREFSVPWEKTTARPIQKSRLVRVPPIQVQRSVFERGGGASG